MTTIYFDTNVYRHVKACNEVSDLKHLLRSNSVTLIASSTNLIETFAISLASERDEELRSLTQLASKFESQPQSWNQALELRSAIGRYRRQWLRPIAFEKRVRFFLQQHRAKWHAACQGEYPDAASYQQFHRNFEYGIKLHNNFQRTIRSGKLNGDSLPLDADTQSTIINGKPLTLRDPEVFWRIESLLSWSAAILKKDSACRDLDDWISPYVKANAFEGYDYPDFWLRSVTPDDVPKNRLCGLLSYYQLDSKVTHGNSQDSQHACHAIDTDHFVTADIPFFEALSKVRAHFPKFAQLHRAKRSAKSALEYLKPILSSAALGVR